MKITKIKEGLSDVWRWLLKHKKTGAIAIIILAGVVYFAVASVSGTDEVVTYSVEKASKGNVISTISGTGQLSSSNQIDIKSQISGDVLYVGAMSGKEVKAGTLLVQIDSTDAWRTVRDAEIALENAQISYDKTLAAADSLSLIQSENSLIQAKESKANTEADLEKSYEDAFSDISNVFLDMPTIMTGLDDIIYDSDLRTYSDNVDAYASMVSQFDPKADVYKDEVIAKYAKAKEVYDKTFQLYKDASRLSDKETIVSLAKDTYSMIKYISESIKSTNNLIDFSKNILSERQMDIPSVMTSHLSLLSGYTSKTNSHITNVSNSISTIESAISSIASAERSIAEKTESLADLKAGPDDLEKRSAELSLIQKKNSLADAKEKYSDYFIRAPFDGVVASVDVKKGDSISSGTAIVTVISPQKFAEISLNEVDISKVKVGQKATLSFDAVDELGIVGEVIEVDTIGTVSQGVVNYGVKVALSSDDERIRPGMSTSVSIIVDSRQDVLVISNSAVKSQGEIYYVEKVTEALTDEEILSNLTLKTEPESVVVEVGISDDDYTEILSGIAEGDIVITKTNSASKTSATKNTASATSILSGSATRVPGSGQMMR